MTASAPPDAGAGEGRRGGVLMRIEGMLVFLPASIAVKVAPPPRITRVPGAPPELLGIALHEGEILPVIAVGTERGPLLVCTYLGEWVGLLGAEVVQTGLFDVTAGRTESVTYRGERAYVFDLAPIYAQIRGVSWAGRWAG